MVACHSRPYPFSVYYCHGQRSNRVFQILLAGEDNGGQLNGVAVCHMGTSPQSTDLLEHSVSSYAVILILLLSFVYDMVNPLLLWGNDCAYHLLCICISGQVVPPCAVYLYVNLLMRNLCGFANSLVALKLCVRLLNLTTFLSDSSESRQDQLRCAMYFFLRPTDLVWVQNDCDTGNSPGCGISHIDSNECDHDNASYGQQPPKLINLLFIVVLALFLIYLFLFVCLLSPLRCTVYCIDLPFL